MSLTATLLDRLLDGANTRPIPEILRDDERQSGAIIILPGEAPWLPAGEWHPDTVVSMRQKKVRLILLRALNPGRGALKRTLWGIIQSGMTPEIVAPTMELQETLKRWGWRCRNRGYGVDMKTSWRPSRVLLNYYLIRGFEK